ncbi:MAG: hypothetical protein ACD_79C00196G0001, partial [uncultured bacterium]
MQNSRNKILFLFILFIIPFIIRYIHLNLMLKEEWYLNVLLSDSYVFVKNAFSIINNDFIGKKVFYQDPLYPLYLALLFKINNGVLFDVLILNIFYSSITCLNVFFMVLLKNVWVILL